MTKWQAPVNRNGKYVTPGNVCHYCLCELSLLTRTKDHLVPRARGGLDVRWNILYACRDCNSWKANAWPDCSCSVCSRSRRRHWEMLRIKEED